jgi:hypothetical protein
MCIQNTTAAILRTHLWHATVVGLVVFFEIMKIKIVKCVFTFKIILVYRGKQSHKINEQSKVSWQKKRNLVVWHNLVITLRSLGIILQLLLKLHYTQSSKDFAALQSIPMVAFQIKH